MDPVACAVTAILHHAAGRLNEARAARRDLNGWIARGGFRPAWPEIVARYAAETGGHPVPTRFARAIRASCAGEEDSRESGV